MIFFLSILFHAEKIFAEVRIENGFFVIGSNPKTTTLEITDSNMIFCSGFCTVINGNISLSFSYKGFNTIKNIALLTKSEKNWQSFQSTTRSRMVVSKARKEEKTTVQSEEATTSRELDMIKTEEAAPSGVSYTFPYPSDKTVFLHHSGGKIFFLPKGTCDSGCIGFVRKVGTKFGQRISFEKGQLPFWSIQIPESTDKTEYQWSFEDGNEKQDHSFFVWKNNKENFKESLSVGTSIEVLQ